MALRVGRGYIDLLPRLASGFESQLASVLRPKAAKTGADAGGFFAKNFADRVKSQFKGFTGLIPEGLSTGTVVGVAAIAGAVEFAKAVKGLAEETAAYADRIRDVQRISGQTAEEASAIVAQADALGISTEKLARPFATLEVNLSKGGGPLKTYFTTAELATMRTQDLTKTLPQLAEKYQSLRPGVERTSFAVAVFGKRGLDLNKILAETPQHLKEIADDAKRGGLIFSQKDLDNAHKFEIESRQLGATLKGLKIEAGKIAIPPLTNLTENVKSGILGTEDAVRKSQAVLDRIPKGIREAAGGFERGFLDVVTLGAFELFQKHAKGANDAAAMIPKTLDQINNSAAVDVDAAKSLQKAFTDAFTFADAAAADFDKRLDALVPKIDDTFSGAKTPAERAQAVADAATKVTDAEHNLADARARASESQDLIVRTPGRDKALAEDRRGVADAERELADARAAAAKAGAVSDVPGIGDLEKTIAQNKALLTSFAGDLGILNTRFNTIAVKGGEEAKQSFLAHLQDLGPAAVPLLDQLVKSSDTELSKLAGSFGDQVQAAKRAADIQFDKFPKNFADKILATRAAAKRELEGIVDDFKNMTDKSDPGGLFAQRADESILKMEELDSQGKLHLSSVQKDLLDAALNAGTLKEKMADVQKVINGIHGKTVNVDVTAVVHDKPLADFLATLNSTERRVFDIQFAPVILPPKKGAATGPPKAIKSPEDVLKGALGGKAAGGPVMKGRSYVVGEEGWEVFQPTENGMVIPHDQALAMANRPASRSRSTTIQVGEVRAHDYHDFRRQMEREERTDALVNGT